MYAGGLPSARTVAGGTGAVASGAALLPYTGAALLGLAALGVALIGAGLLLLGLVKRRHAG